MTEAERVVSELVRVLGQYGGLPTVEQRLNNWRDSITNDAYSEQEYRCETLDLTAARDRSNPLEINMEGNSVALLHLAGASPVVYLRYGKKKSEKGGDRIPMYKEMAIYRPYRSCYLDWPISAGGSAVMLFTTVL